MTACRHNKNSYLTLDLLEYDFLQHPATDDEKEFQPFFKDDFEGWLLEHAFVNQLRLWEHTGAVPPALV